jgi:hypothetical protein
VAVSGRVLIKGAGKRANLYRMRRTLAANARVRIRVPIMLPARRVLRARFRGRPQALARLQVTATDGSGNRRVRRTLVILSR